MVMSYLGLKHFQGFFSDRSESPLSAEFNVVSFIMNKQSLNLANHFSLRFLLLSTSGSKVNRLKDLQP